MHKVITYKVLKGSKYAREFVKEETDLTEEMLAKYVVRWKCVTSTHNGHSGSWKTKTFKPYNFKALGVPIPCGALHPCMKYLPYFAIEYLNG